MYNSKLDLHLLVSVRELKIVLLFNGTRTAPFHSNNHLPENFSQVGENKQKSIVLREQ